MTILESCMRSASSVREDMAYLLILLSFIALAFGLLTPVNLLTSGILFLVLFSIGTALLVRKMRR
ncbi:hypothetical protein NCCP2222_09010 [Sporosarcina sp. NCCP-2222]|nr:hypothetical protein NCCP2222_09010 [Sporosarcina sp. NCCP-2222]